MSKVQCKFNFYDVSTLVKLFPTEQFTVAVSIKCFLGTIFATQQPCQGNLAASHPCVRSCHIKGLCCRITHQSGVINDKISFLQDKVPCRFPRVNAQDFKTALHFSLKENLYGIPYGEVSSQQLQKATFVGCI